MKDLLKLLDLSKEDIIKILNTADQLKYSQKHGLVHDYLRGKTLAMIFEKNSTRTRVSFETGMYQLGGPRSLPLRQGEPDRPGRAHRGHRPGPLPLSGRHHDPHLLPRGGGIAGQIPHPRHQRPHRLLSTPARCWPTS